MNAMQKPSLGKKKIPTMKASSISNMMAKGESQDSEKDLLADVEFPPGEAQKDKQTDVQAIPKATSKE